VRNDKDLFINSDINYLEDQLYYSLEVLRGDYLFHKNFIGQMVIVKVLYIKLKSYFDYIYEEKWGQLSNINRVFLYGTIGNEEYIGQILYIIRFEESRDIFFANRHSSSVLREFIYNLDIIFNREDFNQKIAAKFFFNFNLKLFSSKWNSFFSDFGNEVFFSEIIEKVIHINKKDSIFDPFIGTGGLLFRILSENNTTDELFIEGQDINALLLEICNLQFELFGFKNFQLNHDDSLIDYERNYRKFDKIITRLPKVNINSNRSFRQEGNYYDYLLNLVFNQLSQKGQAYIIVPSSFLYNESKGKLMREKMIMNDVLETIIEFDEMKTLKGATNSVLLIFNKKKEYYKKNKIQIIQYHEKHHDEILQSIENYEQSSKSRIVDLERISNKTFNLTFNNFDPIFDEVKLMMHYKMGQRLADVIEIVKPINFNIHHNKSEGDIPLLKSSNLKRNLDEMYLDSSSYFDAVYCHEHNIKKNQIVDKKALIVCIQGKDLKPTLFDPDYSDYKKIALMNNCIALVINKDEKQISIEDLYFNFYNPIVIRQVEAFKRGAIIKRITYSDLLNVVISNPAYEKQKQFIKYQEEPLRELDKYKKLYETTLINLEEERIAAENNVVNMLIHNVSKHVSVVGHDINKLEKFIYEQKLQNIIYDEMEIKKYNSSPEVRNGLRGKREFITIGDIVNIVKDRLNLVEKTFSDTQKSINLNLEDKDFELMNVKSLLEEIKRDRGVNQRVPYKLEITGEDAELHINQQSFREMIHLLINNAEEHAFINTMSNYRITFKVSKINSDIILEYCNNGSKFELSKENFILAGRRSTTSTGSGLGGAYLHRVVTSHNGNFEIIDTEVGAKFIFTFKRGDRK